jgi:hypothetical protein
VTRHGIFEHVPHRLRLRPWIKRCRCGNALPCPVRATLDRQRFFTEPATPVWTNPTHQLPKVGFRRGPDRPLMTMGQEHRTSQPRK